MVIEPCQALVQNFTGLTKYGSHVYVPVFVGALRRAARVFKIIAKKLLSNFKIVRM